MQTAESSSRKLNNQSEGIPLKISEPWLTSPWHVSNLPSETKRASRCVADEGLSQRHDDDEGLSQLWTGFLLNLFKSAACVLWEDKSASQIIAQSYQWSHWKVVPRRKFQWRCFSSQRNSAFQRINRILKGFFASHLQLMVSLRRNNGFPISWTFQITSLVITVR